jgi:hypothetical protein
VIFKVTDFILVCTATLLVARALAGDSVLFQPITNTDTQFIEKLPASDQWPSWCGVKIVQKSLSVTPLKTSTQSCYTTTDGQRLAGTFELNNTKLSWRNGAFQPFVVDLEKTQSIGPLFIGEQLTTETDTVFLVNNDRVVGFIESIDATTGVSIEVALPVTNKDLAPQKEITQIPIERISEIQLATKIKKPSGWRFWLVDGSVVDADSWSDVQNQCALKNGHAFSPVDGATISWSNILSMSPNSKTITNLARCPQKAMPNTDTQEPRLSPPVIEKKIIPSAFDAIPIDLHGPGTFEFSLEQIGGTLSASLEVPPQLQGDVECRVTIECGGKVVFQESIKPESNPFNIKVPIVGNNLIVKLDQSKRGAFGCAIRLVDAIVISDSCGTPLQPSNLPPNAPAKPGL